MATERIEGEGLPLLEQSKDDSFSSRASLNKVHFNSGRCELPPLSPDSYAFHPTPLAWHPDHQAPQPQQPDNLESLVLERIHRYPSEDKFQRIRFHDWLLEPIYRNTLHLKEIQPLHYQYAFVASCVERETGLSLLFGKMSASFSLFLPYSLQNFEGTLLPLFKSHSDSSFQFWNLRSRSLHFKEFLFSLQRETQNFPFRETITLVCSEIEEPQPDATWKQLVISDDSGVSAFEVSSSVHPEYDFDLLYLAEGTLFQVSLNVGEKELFKGRKIELNQSHLRLATLLDSSHFIYRQASSGMVGLVNVSQMLEKEVCGPIEEKFHFFPSRFSTLLLYYKRVAPLSHFLLLRETESDSCFSLQLASQIVQLAETEKEVILYDAEALHVIKKGRSCFQSQKYPLPNYSSITKASFNLLPLGRLLLEEGSSSSQNFLMRLLIDPSLLREADTVRRMILQSHQNYRFRSQPRFGTLVARLGSRHLSLQNSSLFLTQIHGKPRFCTLYCNNSFGGLTPPLLFLSLLDGESDTRGFALEMWNEREWVELRDFGRGLAYWELHAQLQQLLFLLPTRPTLKQARHQLLEVEEMGKGLWGVFLIEDGVKWEVLSKNQKQALLSSDRSLDFVTVDVNMSSCQIEVRDFVFPLPLSGLNLDQFSVSAESLRFGDKAFIHLSTASLHQTQPHYFFDMQSRRLLQLSAPSLRELSFTEVEERYVVFALKRWFTLEYLEFRYPVRAGFEVTLDKIKYRVSEGAQGMLVMVPIATTCSPSDVSALTFLDYINSHSYFRFRGLALDLSRRLPLLGSEGLFKSPRKKSSELKVAVLRNSNAKKGLAKSMRFESFFGRLLEKQSTSAVENMHLHLGSCDTDSLLVLMLVEFHTLDQMDEVFGKGRFATSLATRIALSQNKCGFFLFEKNLLFLHSQAQSLGLSLQTFYEGAFLKVREDTLEAPDGDNPFKSVVAEEESYLAHLRHNSGGVRKRLQIYRSALRFPPSRHPSTLEFAHTLSCTRDMGVFETKLVQIFIANHWRSSRWLFVVEAVLLLAGLLSLALYASLLRSLFTLVPLLGLQMWTLVVEVVELRRRRCGYCRDFWNLFDWLRALLTLFFLPVMYFGLLTPSLRASLFTLLCLVQSVKAFTVFSLFKSTRLLLRIVIEIVKDMVPFLLFMVATTLVIALLFLASTIEDSSSVDGGAPAFSSSLLASFQLNFGEFPAGELSPLQQFLLVVGALGVPLVLLNMLIAIMSDTFDRVREDQSRRDLQEQIELVYRYEIIAQVLCRCRRKKAIWKYIFFSREKREESMESLEEWEGRVKGLKKEIQKLQSHIGSMVGEKIEEAARRSEQRERRAEEWQKATQEKLEKQQREIKKVREADMQMKKEIVDILEQVLEKRMDEEGGSRGESTMGQ